jgi:hypothetical protein
MAAGCAGVRTGLLALLASTAMRRGDVRKRAEKHLDLSPAPAREDMGWLAREWREIYYPYVQTLRHILARYKDRNELLAPFPDQLCRMLEFDMSKSALVRNAPSFVKDIMGEVDLKRPATVRRELSVLTEYEVLNPVREFLRCYPGDKVTIEGNLCWLNALLSRNPETVWGYISDQLKSLSEPGLEYVGLFSKEMQKIAGERIEAIFLFMQEHPDDLFKQSADRLSSIFNEMLGKGWINRTHFTFLVRLEKLFAERIAAGEISFRPIMDRLRQTLRALAEPAKKPPKTRKGRR